MQPAPVLSGVPQIVTDRLILRGLVTDDFEAYARIMADPDVTRYLGEGRPLTRFEAWRHMAAIVGHWALRGFGIWAVEERSTGRLIGRIGCHEPEGFPAFEVGYVLARDAWGRGYAREGVAASLQYARETLGRTEITSIIRPANAVSIRVATSFGAERAETVDFFGRPSLVYRYPRVP